jgi:hypothetical protein
MWLFNGFPIITHVIAKRGQHYHYVYTGPGMPGLYKRYPEKASGD